MPGKPGKGKKQPPPQRRGGFVRQTKDELQKTYKSTLAQAQRAQQDVIRLQMELQKWKTGLPQWKRLYDQAVKKKNDYESRWKDLPRYNIREIPGDPLEKLNYINALYQEKTKVSNPGENRPINPETLARMYSFNKSRKKSVRKSRRKSHRKSVRKSRRKSVRKSRKSRKSRRKRSK